MTKRETGAAGEKLACNFLCNNGYTIIQQNYRCRDGEMDIIAQKQETLVFFEVRTKKSFIFGSPEESITDKKREKLKTVAENYGQDHGGLPPQWRIDLIAIELNCHGKCNRIEIIENAIEDIA